MATTAFQCGPVYVIIGLEGPENDRRWHMSISRQDRYPSWDEIADARYDLLPNALSMAMFLPPREKYVNCMNFCFHLWEAHDPWLPLHEGTGDLRTHEDRDRAEAEGSDANITRLPEGISESSGETPSSSR